MTKPKKDTGPPAGRRIRAYELPNLVNMQGPKDPLQEIEDQAIQDLNNEYRTLRVEQMIAKRRREVEKMRNGGGIDMGSMPSNADFMKMARMMSDLSPEEQKKVANAYAVLKMADRGQMGGSLGLLGQLMGYARQNPGASEDQMIKYLSLMDSQMVKGMEMMRVANPPRQQGDPVDYMVKGMELMKTTNPSTSNDPLEFLKLVKEMMVEGLRNPIMQAMKELQPQQGVLDQLLTNPELRTTMKAMFGGDSGATTKLDLEIEKLRGERFLTATKWELEARRAELKRQDDDRRADNLIAIFGPIAGAFAGPAAQRMQDLGRQHGSTHIPTSIPPRSMPPLDKQINIQCSCGYQGPITFEGPPPDKINCPSCDLELNVRGNPDVNGRNPEETHTGPRD